MIEDLREMSIDDLTESGLMDKLHEDSMCGHPGKECTARMLKEVLPALYRALEEEIERGTEMPLLIYSTKSLTASFFMTAISNLAPEQGIGELTRILLKDLLSELESCAEFADERAEKS